MAISRRTAHSPIWPGGWTQAAISPSVQGVVALRALGQAPKNNPAPVMDRFFVNEAFKKLPWYATSFFPLFYAALGQPFPKPYDKALRDPPARPRTVTWAITSPQRFTWPIIFG
jgi:hypothetical protein